MPRSTRARHHRRGSSRFVIVLLDRPVSTGQHVWAVVSANTEPQALKIAHKKWGANDVTIRQVPQGQSVTKTVDQMGLDEEDRLAAPGEGGTRARWDYYYNRATEIGIFKPEDRAAYADRHVKTAAYETSHTKANVRNWVRAADDAIASGDSRRIAETARTTPEIPGEVANTAEIRSLNEQLSQADVAGQHISTSRSERQREDNVREFKGIVRNIDALTRSW